MRAVRFHEYGDPSVLTVDEDVPEPHAGPGQVRISVRAAGVNPMDWKLRSGWFHEFMPAEFPATPGGEGAGVVDEVGDGVEDVSVGDEVFGLTGGRAGYPEYAVLSSWARNLHRGRGNKPPVQESPWKPQPGFSTSSESAKGPPS